MRSNIEIVFSSKMNTNRKFCEPVLPVPASKITSSTNFRLKPLMLCSEACQQKFQKRHTFDHAVQIPVVR